MGNTQAAEAPAQLSDREIARNLIEGKRKKTVHYSESLNDESPVTEHRASSLRATNLGSNMMREQKDRDPLFYYEITKVVGVGSMGSVAMVRKRDNAVGGSARKYLVDSLRRQKKDEECFKIPILGNCFRYCMEDPAADPGNTSRHAFHNMLMSQRSDIVSVAESRDSQYAVTYALKSIHLNRITDNVFIEELKNEIEILKHMDHPHIVKPIETFIHKNQLYIVMELCWGGDLYSRDPYTEDEAARIVSSIISAVGYMHSRNIVHRDLKYENILFVNDSPTAEIKLIDFGLSKKYAPDKELTEGVGTIYTMAPEVLKGTYTSQADLWSVGVIAYMLLSSQMPFYGRKRSDIVEQIMACKYDFKGRRWRRISSQAKSFVEDLLVMDPEDRADAIEAGQAMWLNKFNTATVRGPTMDEIDSTALAMKKYASYSHLKKLALMVVAHKSTSAEIGILRKVFQHYDKDKDGSIELPEFKQAFAKYGYPEHEIIEMFDAVDLDGTGKIKYTEFLAASIEALGVIDEQRLAEAFDRLDCDDSGYISAENLRSLLGEDFPEERITEIINEADLTDDNRISYPEFLALWEEKEESDLADIHVKIIPSDSLRSIDTLSDDMSSLSADKLSLREDNLADAKTRARVNFLEGKQLSERKILDASAIDINAAKLVVLNTMDQIVEDEEVDLSVHSLTVDSMEECEEGEAAVAVENGSSCTSNGEGK